MIFRKHFFVLSLPEELARGLKNSEFGDWVWSDHMEKIESLGVPEYIYRLQVTNHKSIYIVRLSPSGEVIQVKYN